MYNILFLHSCIIYHGLLVLIDFEKALFDFMSWSFIHRVLDSFDVGERIRVNKDLKYKVHSINFTKSKGM